MVQISTDRLDGVVGAQQSKVRDEIKRLQEIEAAQERAFKAQKKVSVAVKQYGEALSNVLDLGQSKSALAKTFGMTPAKLMALVSESRSGDSGGSLSNPQADALASIPESTNHLDSNESTT